MYGRRILPFVLSSLLVSACALIADLGERTLESRPRDDGGDTTDDDKDRKSDDDTDDPDDDDDVEVPSYCDGITFYASFDAKLTGDRGGESTLSIGGVTQTSAGKFGGALSLIHDAGDVDAGAAHYFLATASGNPWPEEIGSLSIWYRAAPGTPALAPVLYRPLASLPPNSLDNNPLRTAGLAFYLRNDIGDVIGLHEKSTSSVFVFSVAAMAPYLEPNAYNHFFTAWQHADAGPTAFIAVNGGLGTAFGDAGAGYPDASPDTNGDLRVPYRGFTSRPWVSEGPPVGLRLGGLNTNTPDGTFDDLVIWNRVLSFEEVAAVYSAGRPVGEVCKIR
jgi:hypothetical protein